MRAYRRIKLGLVLVLALSLGTWATLAQTEQRYRLVWNTFVGSSATLTGNPFSLHGTAGQPSTSVLRGGPFVLEGGFWPGAREPSTLHLPLALKDGG